MYFYKKISLVGLGFKTFVQNGNLWIFIGLSHFMKFRLSPELFVICKKKKIYLFSSNKNKLFDLIKQLKYYRIPNKYKERGILEFKQFKGFIKLKKGKKS